MNLPAFEVSREGLKKILSRRGVEFAVLELIQNAFDENISTVEVRLLKMPNRRDAYELTVTDDCPEGFKDLSHAWTLFAESAKKSDPEKRGRFNLGEKLVIAACEEASIETTTGCVEFEGKTRRHPRRRRDIGSEFRGVLRLTVDEFHKVVRTIHHVLVPHGVRLALTTHLRPTEIIKPRVALNSVVVTLPTEIADEEGYLRPTRRQTQLVIFEPRTNEIGTLYELGIPVVETGDTFHVNVLQKIPLNVDRDNVTPAYLREVRAATLNVMSISLDALDASRPWVKEALESKDIQPVAVTNVLTKLYGERRVIADPSDPEGTKLAVADGYAVIQPGSFSAEAWESIRRSGAALPAGQVTPSPKPFAPDGTPLKLLDRSEWSRDIKERVTFTKELHERCGLGELNVEIVEIATGRGWPFRACYRRKGLQSEGASRLILNLGLLGNLWFSLGPVAHGRADVLRLLIHEFAHHQVSDHLSTAFHEECCRLGGVFAMIALEDPALFGRR